MHTCVSESHIRAVLSSSQFQPDLIWNYHSQLIHLTDCFPFLVNFLYGFFFFPCLYSSKKKKKLEEKHGQPICQRDGAVPSIQNSFQKTINVMRIAGFHVLHGFVRCCLLASFSHTFFFYKFLLHQIFIIPTPQFFKNTWLIHFLLNHWCNRVYHW